jgi:mono/diheme cytochrome c family protein
MRGTTATGVGLLVAALVAAVAIVAGLFVWDQSARSAEAALRPAPVAPLAAAAQTPAMPLAPAAVSAAPSPAPGADPAMGQRVFTTLCNGCHPSANAGIGPALHGPSFSQRYPDDLAIATFVRAGRGSMPAFTVNLLSDADLANVIAYLRTLSTTSPSPAIVAGVAPTPAVTQAPLASIGVAVKPAPSSAAAAPSPAAAAVLSQAQLSQIQPGLSGYMLEAAKRMSRSWFAAQAANWDEAAFEVREARDVLHRGGLKSNAARQQAIEGVNSAFLDPLVKAAQAGDPGGYEPSFRAALQGCNACHASQAYAANGGTFGFIRLRVPTNSIWDIYDYSGQGR